MFQEGLNTLYLDLDGVLADFDTLGSKILGMPTREHEQTHGTVQFYSKLRQYGSFFLDLPLMPGALELYNAVKHLKPKILSGIPWQIPEATTHKVAWVHKNIDPDLIVITPRSRDKNLYCIRNDIIVDDWPQHKAKWLEKGGIWIDHRTAEESIAALKAIGVLK